jgi:hypothetical protein
MADMTVATTRLATYGQLMRIRLVVLAISVLLLIPAVARASLADEQRQGQDLVAQLRAGTKTCRDLAAADFDHIGEFVMGRALGSISAHQAMNGRMTAMMGDQAEGRVHQLLGARYVDCSLPAAGTANGYGSMNGSGMMGGYYGSGGFGAIMGSGDWGWMMGAAWRHMTRQDWRHLQQRLLGTNASNNSHHGLTPLAIVAVALGAVVLIGVAIIVIRRPPRRPPAAASSP